MRQPELFPEGIDALGERGDLDAGVDFDAGMVAPETRSAGREPVDLAPNRVWISHG